MPREARKMRRRELEHRPQPTNLLHHQKEPLPLLECHQKRRELRKAQERENRYLLRNRRCEGI